MTVKLLIVRQLMYIGMMCIFCFQGVLSSREQTVYIDVLL